MQFNLFLNFILFPGLRNDDQTNTDPVAWSMTPNIPGNLNLSVTTFCHKIKIYILLTFCYTFPLISVLRIWYNIKLEKNLSLKTGIGIFSCYKNCFLLLFLLLCIPSILLWLKLPETSVESSTFVHLVETSLNFEDHFYAKRHELESGKQIIFHRTSERDSKIVFDLKR